MLRALLLVLLMASTLAGSRLTAAQTSGLSLPQGAVIPSVAAVENPQQTYALYLPKRYSAEKRWPVVYVFDPLARGELALRQFEHAAESHGFIVAASNNSRNGPGRPQIEAAQAVVHDTQLRFSIDTRRIYFAGFSGGARVSAQLALLCQCAAGVLLSGAGFPQNAPPSFEVKLSVFSAVGNADFNYREVIPLQEQLEKAGLPHWLRVFDGSHEWATPAAIDEALAWFSVQAMKSNLEPRNEEFIAAQLATAKQRAESSEKSGDVLFAWREYRQIAATFDSLADASVTRAKSESLEKDKTVRDGLKRERGAFAEQDRLGDEVLSAVSAASNATPAAPPEQPKKSAQELARDLRQRSLAEKKPDRVLVLKRAVGGVFIGSIEAGNAALEKKDYLLAAQYFACAAEANPESEWVFRQLAVARALSRDRRGAIEALRSARKLTIDASSFSEWCKQESGFTQLRGMPDFRAIAE
jgi:dienelactone hydrolase